MIHYHLKQKSRPLIVSVFLFVLMLIEASSTSVLAQETEPGSAASQTARNNAAEKYVAPKENSMRSYTAAGEEIDTSKFITTSKTTPDNMTRTLEYSRIRSSLQTETFLYSDCLERSIQNQNFSCIETEIEGVAANKLAQLIGEYEEYEEKAGLEMMDNITNSFCSEEAQDYASNLSIEDLKIHYDTNFNGPDELLNDYFEERGKYLLGESGFSALLTWNKQRMRSSSGSTTSIDIFGMYASSGLSSADIVNSLCTALEMAQNPDNALISQEANERALEQSAEYSQSFLDQPFRILMKEMSTYLNEGDYEQAIARVPEGQTMYEAGSLTESESSLFWTITAEIYLKQENYTAALEAQLLALKHTSDMAINSKNEASLRLGRTYSYLEDYESELNLYLTLKDNEIIPGDGRPYSILQLRLAFVYIHLNDAEKALPYAENSHIYAQELLQLPIAFAGHTTDSLTILRTMFELLGDDESADKATELLSRL